MVHQPSLTVDVYLCIDRIDYANTKETLHNSARLQNNGSPIIECGTISLMFLDVPLLYPPSVEIAT